AYWNWAPLFRDMLSDIHQSGIADGARYIGALAIDPNETVVGFNVNAPEGASKDLLTKNAELIDQIASGDGRFPFQGPLCSTGQRMGCLGDGDFIDGNELQNMCWFVKGIVEKDDPANPMSMDHDAKVPAQGDCKPTM